MANGVYMNAASKTTTVSGKRRDCASVAVNAVWNNGAVASAAPTNDVAMNGATTNNAHLSVAMNQWRWWLFINRRKVLRRTTNLDGEPDNAEICRCPCHKSEAVLHFVPCCGSCPRCGRDVKTEAWEQHSKGCGERVSD
jgi:hypothetical protein